MVGIGMLETDGASPTGRLRGFDGGRCTAATSGQFASGGNPKKQMKPCPLRQTCQFCAIDNRKWSWSMRIAAIVCATALGFAGSAASAACNWNTAKTDDVVASVTTPTPAPSQSTPVKLPEPEEQS
jgi:hypothetical protein